MNSANINLALTLLISLLSKSQEISALIKQAKGEGRDISDAELDGLVAADDAARAELVAAIEAARS
jgi:hypothetical protein